MNDLTVTTRTVPAGAVLALAGELDHHTAPRVREVLHGLPVGAGDQLVVDLSGLTFCDSSGITVLIAARNHALTAQAGIALVAVPERVARIFRIIGLDRVFPTHDTAQDAVDAWPGPAAG